MLFVFTHFPFVSFVSFVVDDPFRSLADYLATLDHEEHEEREEILLIKNILFLVSPSCSSCPSWLTIRFDLLLTTLRLLTTKSTKNAKKFF